MSAPAFVRRLVYSEAALTTSAGYRFSLRRRNGVTGPAGLPDAPWRNTTLKTRRAWETAVAQVRALGLCPHQVGPKNWDGLGMLSAVLEQVPRRGRVLDAGADIGSALLPWLFLYGYRDLVGINLTFDRPIRRGTIRYEQGDITRTRFAAASFDAVLCQSVLEHGVDTAAWLAETARLLKPGGMVMISVDYWDRPVDTGGCRPFGLPYRVFSRADVTGFLATAAAAGLTPEGPVDLSCDERAVRWEAYGLEYTFLMLTLRKTTAAEGRA